MYLYYTIVIVLNDIIFIWLLNTEILIYTNHLTLAYIISICAYMSIYFIVKEYGDIFLQVWINKE